MTSKAVAKHGAPKAGAIPWLGMLEKVTTIQRLNTEGGIADATKVCDASKNGAESESAYSSDYYFYAEEVTARAALKNYS